MNDIITDIKKLELETINNLKNSKANNTLRAYQSDFRDFSVFCAKNGLSSILTREPGGTKSAERIRKIILDDYFHTDFKNLNKSIGKLGPDLLIAI